MFEKEEQLEDRKEVVPKESGDEYIRLKEFCAKYNLDYNYALLCCKKGKLVCKSIIEQFPYTRRGKPYCWNNKRWHVLNVPPSDHPDFKPPRPRNENHRKITQGNFDKMAAIYLQRFDAARVAINETKFSRRELGRMLSVSKSIIERWVHIGIDGYGKLPRLKMPGDKTVKTSDTYFDTKDIRRFLQKELADPTIRFYKIDDAIEETNLAELAEQSGYYVWDPSKVYPKGFEGFMKWAKENLMREDKALGKWVPFEPLPVQIEAYKGALILKPDGSFMKRFIRFCRPRGDVKSFDACALAIYRFFNMYREKILFAANSKDQADYALFEEAKNIIMNSPKLMDTPGLVVSEKEVTLFTGPKDRFARMKPIASKQGLLSNTTCIVFSEIYKQTDHKFIVELEGSIRLVPNAMSIIESTVSKEGTYYHRQYKLSLTGKDPTLYFQYYCDRHENPAMTQEELDHYEESFFPEEYNMFFRNRWGDAGEGLFSDAAIFQMGVAGFDGIYGPSPILTEAIKELLELQRKLEQLRGHTDTFTLEMRIGEIMSKMMWMDSVYTLPAETEDLYRIREIFKCSDFFIGVGIDRAEMLTPDADRTSMFTTARAQITEDKWFAFILDAYFPRDNASGLLKNRMAENAAKFGHIAKTHAEKAQCLDLVEWLNLSGYEADLVSASYESQRQFIRPFYTMAKTGHIKCPTVPIWMDDDGVLHYELPPPGVKDILRLEMSAYEHINRPDKKTGWFGSRYKKTGRTKKGEAKDDGVEGLAHSIAAAQAGDVPSEAMSGAFSGANVNTDVVGDWTTPIR